MWVDGFMVWLLQSPLHWLASGSILLVQYRGRKSRRLYTRPVNYVSDGNTFYAISLRSRIWWRNLRGGQPVIVRVRGMELEGVGEVFEDGPGVAAGLTRILERAPRYARYFDVKLTAEGRPDPADVQRAAGDRVVIRISAGLISRDEVRLASFEGRGIRGGGEGSCPAPGGS